MDNYNSLRNNLAAANYFIDIKSDIQISKNHEPASLEFINKLNSGLIVSKVGIDKIYNCGHCDNEHHHDLIVFSTEFQSEFYASSEDFDLKK